MKLKQLSVFLDKPGRVSEIATALGEAEVNILTLTLSDAADFSVLRLIVDKPDAAFVLLREREIGVTIREIIAVEVEDKPGALANILKIMAKERISVEYLYAFSEKKNDNIVLIFCFSNPDEAIKILKKNGLNVLSEKALGLN